jgi:uncharacterized membrane protein
MNKIYLSAGIVILIGVVIMAIAVAMLLAISATFWNDLAYGTVEDYIADGKQADLYSVFYDIGLLIVFVGIAIMAFGFASTHSQTPQYRQVETMIPPTQYPPQ